MLDLTFETDKFICTRAKNNPDNINFTKIPRGTYIALNELYWDYWVYDTWEQMNQVWEEYYSPVFPPEDDERHYFDEEYM